MLRRVGRHVRPLLVGLLCLFGGSAAAQTATPAPPAAAPVCGLPNGQYQCIERQVTDGLRAAGLLVQPGQRPATPPSPPAADRATRDRRDRDRREACYVERRCADSDNPDACRCACRGVLYHLDENGVCYTPSLRQLDRARIESHRIIMGHGQNIMALDTRMRAIETRLNMPTAAPLPYDDFTSPIL
jgi:hypothetical protein